MKSFLLMGVRLVWTVKGTPFESPQSRKVRPLRSTITDAKLGYAARVEDKLFFSLSSSTTYGKKRVWVILYPRKTLSYGRSSDTSRNLSGSPRSGKTASTLPISKKKHTRRMCRRNSKIITSAEEIIKR